MVASASGRHAWRTKQQRRNLEAAYTRWIDSKGESADDWLTICADDIEFGSLAHGRRQGAIPDRLTGAVTR